MLRKLVFLLVILPMLVFGQTRIFTLDEAIGDCVDTISNILKTGARVTISGCDTEYKDLSDYIVVEIRNYTNNNTHLHFVEKENNPEYFVDIEFSEEEKQILKYRLLIRVFNAETGDIKSIQMRRIKLDGILAMFLDEDYIPHVTEEMSDLQMEKLADIRRELEQMRAQIDDIEVINRDENYKEDVELQLEMQAETASEITDIVQVEKKEKRYFLFSTRPEFVTGTAAMAGGVTLELGGIASNGFYSTVNLSGGEAYFGGGGKFGYCFNKDGTVKNVIGASVGYWNIPKKCLNNKDNDNNLGFAGVFWKLMLGGKNNIDITNKVLFGPRDKCHFDNTLWHSSVDNVTYSLSVGYTLTRKRKK